MTKDKLQDAFQELIEIEYVANSLRGLIHEVGQGVLQPRPLDLFGVGEDAASLGLTDGLDDGRRQLNVLATDEADLIGKVAAQRRFPGPFPRPAGVDQDRLPDLDLIARLEQHVADGLIVDEGAVDAAAINEAITFG